MPLSCVSAPLLFVAWHAADLLAVSRCRRPARVLKDGAWWSGVATFGLTALLPLQCSPALRQPLSMTLIAEQVH